MKMSLRSLSCEFKSCLFLSVLFFLKVLLNVSSSQTLKQLSGTPCLMTIKLKSYFADPESAKGVLLDKVTLIFVMIESDMAQDIT